MAPRRRAVAKAALIGGTGISTTAITSAAASTAAQAACRGATSPLAPAARAMLFWPSESIVISATPEDRPGMRSMLSTPMPSPASWARRSLPN